MRQTLTGPFLIPDLGTTVLKVCANEGLGISVYSHKGLHSLPFFYYSDYYHHVGAFLA